MGYTQDSINSLIQSIAEFQSKLPADQKEVFANLEKVLEIALSANPPRSEDAANTASSEKILESGKTQALMSLAAQYVASKDDEVQSPWTVTTVTTALATSRWLC